MKNKISSDLSIVLIMIVLTLIFVIIPVLENTIVRTILGIPFVLFIPGYVLIAVLFPKKDDLDTIERVALSFGLSIAIVPLLGLLLNYTFGIRLIPILITLCIYSIGLIFIAEYRRRQLSEEDRFKIPFNKIYENIIKVKTPRGKIDIILTIMLIFSMVMAIGTLINVITIPKIGEKFTEFYILNSTTRTADNYPRELRIYSPTNILIGVVNHEYANVNYTIRIDLDKDILLSKDLMLKNNQTWEEDITFVPDKKGNDKKLEFLLFKEKNFTAPYRELHLWVNITI